MYMYIYMQDTIGIWSHVNWDLFCTGDTNKRDNKNKKQKTQW